MKSLTLLRHAKTVDGTGAPEDHERALTPRGLQAAAALAGAAAADRPDLILCSTALRTRQTLAGLAIDWAPEIVFDPALYLADRNRLFDRILSIDDRFGRVWLIGHNPGLHEFARHCAARARGHERYPELGRRFPTAARASFESEAERWSEFGRARLTLTGVDLPP